MKRPLVLLAMVACAFAPGCAPSGEDAVVADMRARNNEAAEAVAKAEDVAAVKAAFAKRDERARAIIEKLQKLPADERSSFQKNVAKRTAESDANLEKALGEFTNRLKGENNPLVLLDTSAGPIKIELYEKLAPQTVKNFLQYVDDKHYDGTIFHRVISDFMVQGGGFEPGMKEKEGRAPIENESYNGLTNKRGTLAMARTDQPHSASDQFFINVKDNDFLDKLRARDEVGYAVFGRVIEGMDTVDAIRKVETGKRGGHGDVPLQDVVLKTARRVK